MQEISPGGSTVNDKTPILYLDINFGNGQISRIVLFEGDQPDLVVQNFAKMYSKN